jgi:hypothetical protein
LFKLAVSLLAAACVTPALACGSSPAAPQPPPPVVSSTTPLNLSGPWSGTGSDIKGGERLSWTLTQTGSQISGPVQMTPMADDGSCASCHKLKKGSVAGTIAGNRLMLQLTFPSGGDDATPLCSFRMDAEATDVTSTAIAARYSVDDTCEGLFSGTFLLAR